MPTRIVIWSDYQYKLYEVAKETPQRIYGQLIKSEGDRWSYSPKWIDRRRAVAEVVHEDRDKAIEAAKILLARLEDIRERQDAEELRICQKYHTERDEVLKPYRNLQEGHRYMDEEPADD